MEDEDYFEFSDDILVASTEKIQFRDTAIYINSSTDGQLDLVADTEIQIAATTIDINGAVVASGEIAAASLDISGDIDVDGTTNLDVVDIDGAVDMASTLTVAGVVDITDTTDSSDATGDTGALRTEGGASIAKKLYVGTDLDVDGTTNLDTVDIDGTVDMASTLATGGLYTAGAGITSTASPNIFGTTSFSDANITNVGSIALDTITNDGTDITLDSSGDIILDAAGNNVTIKSAGTSILDIANNSTDVELTVSTADKNFAIKGTDGSSAITALDIDMALAGKATFSGDVVVTGDLTITGDDLVMGTNTSGHILVADGTNFNPTAVGDLSEISTVANDDVFLAVDTSGGGLKKITRSAVVAGLATSSAISNVSEDSTPQLGGNLDLNGSDIVTTSNATLDLAPNGTGTVVVRGNTNSGAVVFNCESNSHGQKVYGQPHSAAVTNTLMLPAGADSTLVSLVSADTLTNKTFGDNTSFGDNNITNVGDIALDSISADGTDINVAVSDNSATAFTIKQGSDAYLIIDTGNSSESVSIGTGISGTAITIGHGTSEVTFGDNVTVTGDFTVNGTTSTVATTNLTVTDPLVKYGQGYTGTAYDQGFIITRGNGSSSNTANRGFIWDESADEFATIAANTEDGATAGNVTINDYAPLHVGAITADDNSTFSGEIAAASLDISGNIDIDGTANLDIVDIDGAVDMASTLQVDGVATFTGRDIHSGGITIANAGQIGSVGDADAIAIASDGVVTLTQKLIGTELDISGNIDVDGTTNLDVVDIDGAVDMASTLAVAGVLTANGGAVFNEDSADVDFRIESNGNANMFVIDANADSGAGQVNIGATTNAPAGVNAPLHVAGFANTRLSIDGSDSSGIYMTDSGAEGITIRNALGNLEVYGVASHEFLFNKSNIDVDFRVASDDNTHMLFVDGGNDKVAIGTSTATATLTVEGSAVAKTDTDTSNSGSVTLDFTANQNFVLTMTGNVTLANPSTENVGQSGFIACIQDGTGSRTLSLGTDYETAGGAGITLSTAASATDLVPYVVIAANRILLGAPQLAFS